MSVPGRLVAVQITKYTPISPIFSRDVITYLRFLACKIDLNAETHRALFQPVCLFICASYGLPKFIAEATLDILLLVAC
jgi:hypothetical protein